MVCECDDDEPEQNIDHEKVDDASKLIRRVYKFCGAGGNLHIVIDDGNSDAGSIRWCLDDWMVKNPHKSSEKQLAAERRCADALLKLTEAERDAAIDLAHRTMRAQR